MAKTLKLKTVDGRQVDFTIYQVRGHVSIESWDGESELLLSCMTQQNGQFDVAATNLEVDGPIKSRIFTSTFSGRSISQTNDVKTFPKTASWSDRENSAIGRALEWAYHTSEDYGDESIDPRLTEDSLKKLGEQVHKIWLQSDD